MADDGPEIRGFLTIDAHHRPQPIVGAVSSLLSYSDFALYEHVYPDWEARYMPGVTALTIHCDPVEYPEATAIVTTLVDAAGEPLDPREHKVLLDEDKQPATATFHYHLAELRRS